MAHRFLLTLTFVAIGIVAFGSSAIAQDQRDSPGLTRMSNDDANIVWTVIAPNAGGTLTISTPTGEVTRQEFKSGNSPIFSSDQRITASDGQYRFEIVLTPIIPGNVRAALNAARAEGRADEVYENFVRSGIIPPRMIESGAFRVLNGMIYTADSGPEPGVPKQDATTGQPKSFKCLRARHLVN